MLDKALTLPCCFLNNLIPPVGITGKHLYGVSYTTLFKNMKKRNMMI